MLRPLGTFAALGLCGLLLGAAGPQQDSKPEFWQVIEKAVAKQKLEPSFTKALQHIQGVPGRRKGVANRLTRVDRSLLEPWAPPALAADLKQRLSAPLTRTMGSPFPAVVPRVAEWLDMTDYRAPGDHPELKRLNELWQLLQNPDTRGLELLKLLLSRPCPFLQLLQLLPQVLIGLLQSFHLLVVDHDELSEALLSLLELDSEDLALGAPMG